MSPENKSLAERALQYGQVQIGITYRRVAERLGGFKNLNEEQRTAIGALALAVGRAKRDEVLRGRKAS